MSTAFHQLPSLKRKSSSNEYIGSARVDLETEEAGSILVSLSQQKPKMSIHNLLDKNDHREYEDLQKPSDWIRQKKQTFKPKIRRCALQAYISYRIYSDLARKRMKQQKLEPQQALAPLRNKIVEQPLTDFLRLPPITQQKPHQ